MEKFDTVFLKPKKHILESWGKQLDTPFVFELKELLVAYLMDVMFLYGRNLDYKSEYLERPNQFKKTLSSSARDGLFNCICIFKTGYRTPIDQDADDYSETFWQKLTSVEPFVLDSDNGNK